MKIQTRFSLGFLFCSVAFVAIGISHVITSLRLHSANKEIAWLTSARNTSWPDPSGISVVSLNYPWAGLHPERKIATWHWKMMAPESVSLRLRWDASPKTLDAAPTTIDNASPFNIPLPNGTYEIVATVKEDTEGKLLLVCTVAGTQIELPFDGHSRLFSHTGFTHHVAGVRETEVGLPTIPFLLACLRDHAGPNTPSEGIRIWIEPVPKETEQTIPSESRPHRS